MTLPKALTTVTPVSKTLAAILFILLPFAGFYFGSEYQRLIPADRQPHKLVTYLGPTKAEVGLVTYKNTTHKYSVNYPADWTIDTTSADQVEKYEDSECCNVATLTITNGKATWLFDIDRIVTGYLAPDECEGSEDRCSSSAIPITVLGYQVERGIIRSNGTNKIVYAGIHGFGAVGFTTQSISADHPKFSIDYKGDVENYLDILDEITQSLKPIY